MKIFKYIIFLLILTSIFAVIYRESNHKGFRRCRIFVKIAVFSATIETGLILTNIKTIQPPGNNNQFY